MRTEGLFFQPIQANCFTIASQSSSAVLKLSVSARLRKDYVRTDGRAAVQLQVILNRKVIILPISILLHPQHFDQAKGSVRSSHPQYADLNLLIDQAKARVNEIAVRYRLAGRELSAKDLRLEYRNPSATMDFLVFYENQLNELYRKRIIVEGTFKQQRATLAKLRAYQSPIPFYTLDKRFVQGFRAHLQNGSQQPTTIATALKNLKKYLNLATDQGIPVSIDTSAIKVQRGGSRRESLTPDQVKTLLHYYRLPLTHGSHKKALQWFLFSCFTGLRISDMKSLSRAHFIDGRIIKPMVKNSKSGKLVDIPVPDIALTLVNPAGALFHEITEQKINRYIKEAAAVCGIRTKLTLHVGRHTFATSFLHAGGSVEVLQQLLGHSKISDTMGYVHIVGDRKKNEMEQFNRMMSKL